MKAARVLKAVLWLIPLAAICWSAFYLVRHALHMDQWHNNDELAHLDYVYKMAHEYRIPGSTELVHRDLVAFSSRRFSYPDSQNLALPDYGIGLQAYSYEAQQPLLYYAVLAVPEGLMAMAGADLGVRIKMLRLITVLMMLAGWLIFYLALRPLRSRGLLSQAGALWLTAFLAFFSAPDHYPISNDQPGLLWGALLTGHLLKAGLHPSWRSFGRALTLCLLALVTKLSNALWLVPVLGLYAQMAFAGRLSVRELRVSSCLLALWPGLILLPHLLAFLSTSSDALSETARLFSVITPGMFDGLFFIEAFLYKAFGLQVAVKAAGADWPYVVLLWMIAASVLWVYLGGRLVQQQPGLLWLMLTWPLVFFVAAFLSRHVGSVFWFEFRIFTSYYPVLILFVGLPPLLWKNYFTAKSAQPSTLVAQSPDVHLNATENNG